MNAPFSKRIREAALPPKFRLPSEKYSETEDPISHLERFVHQMEVQNATRSALCRMFPSILTDCAKTWLRKLPPEQLQIKVEHDEARLALHPRKKTPKHVPVKRFQNQPPNRSTYKPPPIPSYQEWYPTRRSPLRRSPPRAALMKEVAQVAREEYVYNNYTPSMFQEKPSTSPSGIKAYSGSQVIHTISGGPILAGTSNNSMKNHARKIPRLNVCHEIFKVSSGSRDPSRTTKIVFTEEDVYNKVQPLDDPMVISIQIANCRVHRVLINTGSSVDILFKGAHEQLNLKNSYYNSCTSLLYGFIGDSVMPIGFKILPVIVREAPL
ncbi:hypothetical protein LWI28_023195 [Acer negundo]|uniref:Uncharacterized protein n=1 Tax=Acer negundo TaxID=4023 RepID=A0AAD5J2L0_ACENE|nr:hypothetical protein LWI28_023195 [Acer negundo]